MFIYQTIEELSKARKKRSKNSCGLVPTMGALHQGHLELIKKAVSENETVWVSIFVNPTQFNNPNDLENYPVNLDADIHAIHKIDPNIHIFAPEISDMYPEKIQAQSFLFDGLDLRMEGKDRPGHFEGVLTIVSKLFSLVRPNRAYFGEKDFQQLQIIKNWVHRDNIPTTIVPCPIVREPNGLAMSSRNNLLSAQARQEAGFVYDILSYCAHNTMSKDEMYAVIERAFEKHPSFTLQYAICADEASLNEVSEVKAKASQRLFVAASVENVRLIDNIALK